MTRLAMLGMLAALLGGCVVTDREQLYYTRADVDAITAGIQCRNMARSLVQVSRCEVRR